METQEAPAASVRIVDSVGKWPHPLSGQLYDQDRKQPGVSTWIEVDADTREHTLEVLPPIYFEGGFMCSEPANHDERGRAVFTAVVDFQERSYMRDMAEEDAPAEAAKLRAFLRNGGKAQ